MIRKILEALFRHRWLLLAPPILIPGIVTPVAFKSAPPVFESGASVWIDHPAYLTSKGSSNSWEGPVQTQAARLSELLRTRAFVSTVAQRTSLANLTKSAAGQTILSDMVTKDITIGGASVMSNLATSGADHLLIVRVQSTSPQVAYEFCKAILEAYQEKMDADQADQASAAVDFYQARVQDAQKQLTQATSDLRRYSTAHQADGLDATDPTQQSLAAQFDPKLAALQANLQTAQLAFKDSQSALTQAQQEVMIAAQGQQYGFQVLDPPQVPIAPTTQLKKLIIYPIAAVIVGLGLTAIILVLLVASDRSMRSEQDLAPGVRLLGSIPKLRLKRVPKGLRSVAARRGIGAAAGMALPAASGGKP